MSISQSWNSFEGQFSLTSPPFTNPNKHLLSYSYKREGHLWGLSTWIFFIFTKDKELNLYRKCLQCLPGLLLQRIVFECWRWSCLGRCEQKKILPKLPSTYIFPLAILANPMLRALSTQLTKVKLVSSRYLGVLEERRMDTSPSHDTS